jgi:hypothetical protein
MAQKKHTGWERKRIRMIEKKIAASLQKREAGKKVK